MGLPAGPSQAHGPRLGGVPKSMLIGPCTLAHWHGRNDNKGMKPTREELKDAVKLRCPFCGRLGAVPVDIGGGEHQTYVEECPTCCHPLVVHIERAEEPGIEPRVWLEREDG